MLQVQRLPHIKTLVRRPPPPQKKKHSPTAPHQKLKRLPKPCSPFDGAHRESTWKRTRLSKHKRKHGYSAGGKDARAGKSNDDNNNNNNSKRNKQMRSNRKQTAKCSLTRNCGLTVKHLQRRTPCSAVPVVVRHFGAKAGRVVSS